MLSRVGLDICLTESAQADVEPSRPGPMWCRVGPCRSRAKSTRTDVDLSQLSQCQTEPTQSMSSQVGSAPYLIELARDHVEPNRSGPMSSRVCPDPCRVKCTRIMSSRLNPCQADITYIVTKVLIISVFISQNYNYNCILVKSISLTILNIIIKLYLVNIGLQIWTSKHFE